MAQDSAHSMSVSDRINDAGEDSPEKKNRTRKAFFYIWNAVGAIILGAVTIYLLGVLAIPVSMLLWTLVFVFSLRGIVAGLEKRGVNRLIGVIIAYVIMFAILALIAFLMFSPMFGLNEQFADLVRSIPGYISAITEWLRDTSEKYATFLDNDSVQQFIKEVGSSVSGMASSVASGAANAAVGFGTGVANALTAIGFSLVIAFWILMELPAMGREVKRLMPESRYEDAEFLHLTFTRILGGYIKATILQCFIIGLACGILFAIIGINNAPALGVITGVLNIIPIVGPWLGGAVAAITAVFISPLTAVIAIAGTILIQQFVYTFISPKIMQNSVDIHPALTLVAMIVGSAVGGAMSGLMGSLVGMLFAIPAVAVMKSVFIYYFERSTGRQIVAKDGFLFKGTPTESGIADPLYDATSGASQKKDIAKKHHLFSKKDS